MVEGQAHITVGGVTRTYRLQPLEVAGIVANRSGFQEIDAEPTGSATGWRIRAKGSGSNNSSLASMTVTGSSLREAVSKLVERMIDG